MLEIVNEHDEVIGTETRANIHAQGLLHREVNVWLISREGYVVLQRRGPHKDTAPNQLATSIAGHVEPGKTYEETAIAEAFEETGVRLREEDLIPLIKMQCRTEYKENGTINASFQMTYACWFEGDVDDLTVEESDGAGFEVRTLAELMALTPVTAKADEQSLLGERYQTMFAELQSLLGEE